MFALVCFLPGTRALGVRKGITMGKTMRQSLLTFEDRENLKISEGIGKNML